MVDWLVCGNVCVVKWCKQTHASLCCQLRNHWSLWFCSFHSSLHASLHSVIHTAPGKVKENQEATNHTNANTFKVTIISISSYSRIMLNLCIYSLVSYKSGHFNSSEFYVEWKNTIILHVLSWINIHQGFNHWHFNCVGVLKALKTVLKTSARKE